MEQISGSRQGTMWRVCQCDCARALISTLRRTETEDGILTFMSCAATIAARRRVKESLCFQSTGIVAVTRALDLGKKGMVSRKWLLC